MEYILLFSLIPNINHNTHNLPTDRLNKKYETIFHMRGISVALISDQHLSKLAVILLLLCCFLLLGDDLPTLLWTQASHPSAWCHNDIQGLMWWQSWQEFYWIGGNGWVKHIKAWGPKNFHVWSTDTLWQCGGKNSQRGGKTIIGRHFMNFGHNCPHRNSRVAVRGCPICV